MTSTGQSWRLWNLSKAYRARPSEMLGLENTWDSFCLDSAIWVFGSHIENEMNKIEAKTDKEREHKRDSVLRRYIPELAKAQKFADPGKR